jgi:hypothetical protein
VNYRPLPQIVFKAEWYRSKTLEKPFLESGEGEHKPFRGIATSAVFFF